MTHSTDLDQGKSPNLGQGKSPNLDQGRSPNLKNCLCSFDYLTDDYGFFFVNKKEIIRKKTPLQFIQLFENEHYGKVLLLDGATQLVEKIEHQYHEPLAHIGLLSFKDKVDRVLILGGGDGGLDREVLKHPVNTIDHVELDEEVLLFCKEHLPAISGGAFSNPNVHLFFEDGKTYVEKCQKTYDIIVMDMIDPVGPARSLYILDFFSAVKKCLTKDGVFVLHGESPFLQERFFLNLRKTLLHIFKHVTVFISYVQMYGGVWCFLCCSDTADPTGMSEEVVDKMLKERKITDLKSIDGKTFVSMQTLPYEIRQKLDRGKIIHKVEDLEYFRKPFAAE